MSDDLQFEKENAVARVHELHEEVLKHLTGEATIAERDTWSVKEHAARGVVNATAIQDDINMLAIEAAMSGVEVIDLAQSILAKSAMFKILVGKAAGLRKQGLTAISQCSSVMEVDAVLSNIENQVDIEIENFLSGQG